MGGGKGRGGWEEGGGEGWKVTGRVGTGRVRVVGKGQYHIILLFRYCQVLPKDRYTILTPDFKVEMREITSRTEFNRYRTPGQQYEYCCTLTFPMSSPIKESILVGTCMCFTPPPPPPSNFCANLL